MAQIRAGERFHHELRFEDIRPGDPHIWRTLGYRRLTWQPGDVAIEWEATADYAFPANGDGYIVHGGMVATLLDTAMGSATWTVLDAHETFLTADLRVEFLRATRPGLLRAEGKVVRRARRVVFCAADLYDDQRTHLAAGRCTQVITAA